MPGSIRRLFGRAGMTLALALPALLALSPDAYLGGQKKADLPGLLREIREEVMGLGRYPGEDFARGEFFLGEGDDDTNKTHAVGILVKDETEGSRMTIVVSRLEPSRENPRVKYARDPKTVACTFTSAGIELARSDYPAGELEKLLAAVLKAVTDKKALLKRE